MHKITIEKDVPKPHCRILKLKELPVEEMGIDDSILIPLDLSDQFNSIRGAILRYGRKVGKKFVTRSYPEGLRVWRVQ